MDACWPEFRELVQQSDTLIAMFDQDDQLRYANQAFRQAYALAADGMPTWPELMRSCWARKNGAFIDTPDIDRWLDSVAMRRGKTPYRAFEADLHSGRWIWMTETLAANGWLLCIAVDITALAVNSRDVRHARDAALRASRTDELTGIGNRRLIIEKLAETITCQTPSVIALIDLDYFKLVNDHWGHSGGDAVLIHFTRHLSRSTRRSDVVGRIGGEEFLCIMPGIDLDAAHGIVERLRRNLPCCPISPDFPPLRYSFSAGLTQLRPEDTTESAMARADHACYRAKRTGRDRVVVD